MGDVKGKIAISFGGVLGFIVVSHYLFDIPITLYCKRLDQSIKNIFEFLTALGISTWYLVGSFSLFIFFKYFQKNIVYAHRALFFFVSVAGSGILVILIKGIACRFRPRMLFSEGLYGFNFFNTSQELSSFPSGHAATAFSLALALSLFSPRYRILLLAFALLVSLSRVIISAHYLSDAVVGAYIGIMSVFFLKKGICRWGKEESYGFKA